MNVPVEMQNTPFSLMPEGLNYVQDPSRGAQPAYRFDPPVRDLREDVTTSVDSVNEGMYANLFMMLANLDRRQITAREVDERHEEKLLNLGPVLERQQSEKLKPLVQMLYRQALATGRVYPLPEQYDGVRVDIDYISLLAQAQRAVQTGGIERLYGFLGNLSAADQEVLDLTDNDEAVREYADMLGVPGNLMRDDDAVEERRGARRAAVEQENAIQQAATMAPAVKQGAEAAKVIADTDATSRPVDILRNLGLR